MGLECDEEIVQLVGTESEILDLFSGSLEEPYYLGIYSQDQVRDRTGLGWVGLGWVGLGWVGLGFGLGWVGLGWVGLGWVGISLA